MYASVASKPQSSFRPSEYTKNFQESSEVANGFLESLAKLERHSSLAGSVSETVQGLWTELDSLLTEAQGAGFNEARTQQSPDYKTLLNFRDTIEQINSDLKMATQAIYKTAPIPSLVAASDWLDKLELAGWLNELENALQGMVYENKVREAREIAQRVRAFVEQASKVRPDKPRVQYSWDCLDIAIQKLPQMVPIVLKITEKLMLRLFRWFGWW